MKFIAVTTRANGMNTKAGNSQGSLQKKICTGPSIQVTELLTIKEVFLF